MNKINYRGTLLINPYSHLGQVVRDNNKTRKRTRHVHYPETHYGKPTDKKKKL